MDRFAKQEEPDQVEQGLQRALQHVDAPDGFTDRVMQRVQQRAQQHPLRRAAVSVHRSAAWWSAIAAALLLSAAGSALHTHRLHMLQLNQAQATQMEAQMDIAMQLTGHALDQATDSVERSPAGRYTKFLNEPQK